MKSSKSLLEKAFDNAVKDRDRVAILLRKATEEFDDDEFDNFSHSRIGPTISKYLEALSRANEQIIKIGTVLNKSEMLEGVDDNSTDGLLEQILNNCEEEALKEETETQEHE